MKPLFEFCWMWTFPSIKLSWHSCFIWEKLERLNWFWQFLCEGYLPSIGKDSITHMHGLTWLTCVERSSFCTELISRKFADSHLRFPHGFTSLSVLLLFFYWSHSLSSCMIFDAISSSMWRFSQSTHLIMYLSLETLINVHHKDWVTYSGVTDTPGELYISLLSSVCLSLHLLRTIFQEPCIVWSLFFAYMCKIMISPGFCLIFFNFDYLGH